MSVEPEEWRPVVGWEGLYEVSSLGRVRSLDRVVEIPAGDRCSAHRRTYRGSLLSMRKRQGYLIVDLKARQQDAASTAQVHRMVAEAFLGPAPAGHEVAHNDGVRGNPRLDNLRWATRRDNLSDMLEHGTRLVGDRHPSSKLTEAQVADIRAKQDVSQRELAAHYGVSQSAISLIKLGKTWRR